MTDSEELRLVAESSVELAVEEFQPPEDFYVVYVLDSTSEALMWRGLGDLVHEI